MNCVNQRGLLTKNWIESFLSSVGGENGNENILQKSKLTTVPPLFVWGCFVGVIEAFYHVLSLNSLLFLSKTICGCFGLCT